MTFAQRVEKVCSLAGVSPRTLSMRAGLAPATVGHWQAARRLSPDASSLAKFARVTGTSIEWLLLGSGSAPTKLAVQKALKTQSAAA